MDTLTPTERKTATDARAALFRRGTLAAGGANNWVPIGNTPLFICTRTGVVHACGPRRCKRRSVADGAEICAMTGTTLVSVVTTAAFGAMNSAGMRTAPGTAEQRMGEHFMYARQPERPRRPAPKRPVSGTVESADQDVVTIWGLVTRVLNSPDAIAARTAAFARHMSDCARRVVAAVKDLTVMCQITTGVVNLTHLYTLAATLALQEVDTLRVPLPGAPTPLVAAIVQNIHRIWMVHTAVVMKHASDAVASAATNVPTVAIAAPTASVPGRAPSKKQTAPLKATLEQVTMAVMRKFTSKEGFHAGHVVNPALVRLMPDDTELCELLACTRVYPVIRYVAALVKQWTIPLEPLLPMVLDEFHVQPGGPDGLAPLKAPDIVKDIAHANCAYMGTVEALSSVLHRPPETPAAKRRRAKATTGTGAGAGAGSSTRACKGRRASGDGRPLSPGGGGANHPSPGASPSSGCGTGAVRVRAVRASRRRERTLLSPQTVVLLNPAAAPEESDTPPEGGTEEGPLSDPQEI